MSYYINRTIDLSFDEAVERVTEELKKEGFGVLTTIDVKATLKKKLDVDFPNYRILGACNPPFAHKSLLAEPRIGLMLPCNVIVREIAGGEGEEMKGQSGGGGGSRSVEIAAVDPIASMQAVENPSLGELALEVREKLKRVIDCV